MSPQGGEVGSGVEEESSGQGGEGESEGEGARPNGRPQAVSNPEGLNPAAKAERIAARVLEREALGVA